MHNDALWGRDARFGYLGQTVTVQGQGGDMPIPINKSINLFAKYDNTASIMNSGGRKTRQF